MCPSDKIMIGSLPGPIDLNQSKSIWLPQNLHDNIQIVGTSCLEGRYFSIQALPLDTIISGFSAPEACMALPGLIKFTQQGASFQVIYDSISLVCNPNEVSSAARSSYFVLMGNLEQQQQLGLFWGSLNTSWLIPCREVSHAQQ